LRDAIEFIPRRVWVDSDREERVYNEIFTADWAWQTQMTLPNGAALIPIILASDKTHLTVLAGDKKAWPLYLSIGNIKSNVRNKPTNNTWVIIGYIPCVKFEGQKEYVVVLASLIDLGDTGIEMVDSLGDVRLCFPRLAAYIADYPEQCLINVVSQKTSPVTLARYHNLGDATPSPPRTREWILSQIHELERSVDPSDFARYKRASLELGLNGVHQPFWETLPGYDPSLCVGPDLLHGVHRFWRDHILNWVVNLVGFPEIDRRLKLLQPVVNMRHFSKGISHLTQWTGREDRELQRYLLAVINGIPGIDRKTMKSLRAFHNFAYFAQYRSQTPATLGYMARALRKFHSTKATFIQNGARRGSGGVINHFNIPKLYALHMYQISIPLMGSAPQFSSEITEQLHQTMAKAAYRATNRKDYTKQMCMHLDRCERVAFMEEFLSWAIEEMSQSAHNVTIDTELHHAPVQTTPVAQASTGAAVDNSLEMPLRARNQRKDDRIWLTFTPHHQNLSLADACNLYKYSERSLKYAVTCFVGDYLGNGLGDVKIDLWNKLKIKLPTIQEDEDLVQVRTIQVLPPSRQLPYGRFDFALIHVSGDAERVGIAGYRVAQIRMIFSLQLGARHRLDRVPLAYIHWLSPTVARAEQPVGMYRVKRVFRPNGRPFASVISVESIARFVHLIPRFPHDTSNIPSHATPELVTERATSFLINSFADKELFQCVY
ncbi:hypothetical protein M408DRAFT_306317, partial [Serendipita vermifera MAFF 305830]